MDGQVKYEKALKYIDKYHEAKEKNQKLFIKTYLNQALRQLEAASKENHAEASYRLALYYANNHDFHPFSYDFQTISDNARRYLRKAASQGHALACKYCGDYEMRNYHYSDAFHYYEKAFEGNVEGAFDGLLTVYKIQKQGQLYDFLSAHLPEDLASWPYLYDYAYCLRSKNMELAVKYNRWAATNDASAVDLKTRRQAKFLYAYDCIHHQQALEGKTDVDDYFSTNQKKWYQEAKDVYLNFLEMMGKYPDQYQVNEVDQVIKGMFQLANIDQTVLSYQKVYQLFIDFVQKTTLAPQKHYVALGLMAVMQVLGLGCVKNKIKGAKILSDLIGFYYIPTPVKLLGGEELLFYEDAANRPTYEIPIIKEKICHSAPSSMETYRLTAIPEVNLAFGDLFFYYYTTIPSYPKMALYFYIKVEDKFDRQYEIIQILDKLNNYREARSRLEKLLVGNRYNSPKYSWAMILLGRYYQSGSGGYQDSKNAFRMMQKAAELNAMEANRYLGMWYCDGVGVSQAPLKALEYFKVCLENKHTSASLYFYIGKCYRELHQLDKAEYNFQIASNRGDTQAKKALTELKKAKVEQKREFIEEAKKIEMPKIEIKETTKDEEKVVVEEEMKPQETGAKAKLKALIGLASVKKEVEALEAQAMDYKWRVEHNIPAMKISKHMVFTGNAGTGKTTVARIVAQIFKECGILSKGHLVETDRGGLISQYIGETASKTTKIFMEALGGVLFIDEAYALIPKDSGRDYGPEAIATLIKLMEDHKDDIIVIVAGYGKEMEEFIDSNPGLKSRFTSKIHFPDYSDDELQEIFELYVKKHQDILSQEAKEKLILLWQASHQYKNVGNGRAVRNVYERVVRNRSLRLLNQSTILPQERYQILETDIPSPEEMFS